MTKPLNDDSTERFRAILRGDQEDDDAEPTPAAAPPPEPPAEPPRSVLDLLPRAAKDASAAPEPRRRANPPPEAGAGLKSRKERYRHAFWDVTSWLGLVIDVITIAVILILFLYIQRLNIRVKELMGMSAMPLETVSGLYENFEKMDRAHIVTTIPYNTEIPVQFVLQINQQTEVVLSQDVRINGAYVRMSTGGVEISSAADIVLPAGTRLPITLSSLNVPVNEMLPVQLQVPVDIDLAQTDLGPAFKGLMDVLEPLYCLLDPKAVDRQGISICEKAKTP